MVSNDCSIENCVIFLAKLIEYYIGYLSFGFEYFLSGSAYEPASIRLTLAPSRNRRALSIALFTFPNRSLLALLKCQIPRKKVSSAIDRAHRVLLGASVGLIGASS